MDLQEILLPYQKEWINCTDKYAIYNKSRRIGITYAEALRAVMTRLDKKENYFFVSKEERSGKLFIADVITWCKVLNIVVGESVINLDESTTGQVVLPNGSKITALTSHPAALRGCGGSVCLDEFSFIERNEDVYVAAAPCLLWGGTLRIISTPNPNDYVFDQIFTDQSNGFRKFITTLPDAVEQGLALKVSGTHQYSLPDRAACDKAFIDAIRQGCLSDSAYKQEYLCQRVSKDGLVYDAFAAKDASAWPVVPSMDKLPSRAIRSYGGLDWGSTDPVAALVFVECEDEKVYCVEELYAKHMPLHVLGPQLIRLQEKWSTRFSSVYHNAKGCGWQGFYCDTSRPECLDLMQRFGVAIQNRKVKDIEAGIATVVALYAAKKLKIFDCCTNLIRESEHYNWVKKGQDVKPSEKENHVEDAKRYGISSAWYGRNILPPEQVITDPVESYQRLNIASTKEELERLEQEAQDKKQRDWQIKMLTLEADDPLNGNF